MIFNSSLLTFLHKPQGYRFLQKADCFQWPAIALCAIGTVVDGRWAGGQSSLKAFQIPALQTFQHNLPLPLPEFSGLSAFSTCSPPGGGPRPTNFRVQFYRGALQLPS
jgi:hypothetical protein